MRAPLPRILAAVAVCAALVSIQAPAPAAIDPSATLTTGGCVDGAKVATVHLTAADGADSTFTTTATGNQGEVFRDADHVVAAGTTVDVPLSNLTYGVYSLEVTVGPQRVLQESIPVNCVPAGDYSNPSAARFVGCDRSGTVNYQFSNEPIDGAGGELLPVKFRVTEVSGGTTKVVAFTLPDHDTYPNTRLLTFVPADDPEQLTATANGKPLVIESIATPCPPPRQSQVPDTGF